LLPRLDRRLAGVTIPAAVAADFRRARLPVLSPPQVSTQIAPSWTLDPPQPLPRPRPPASSPEFSLPHSPLGPRAALRGLSSFWGVLCKLRIWLWGFNLSKVQFAKRFFKPWCVLAATMKNRIKSQKIQKLQTQFYCALCDYAYNFYKACIYFWAIMFASKIEMRFT
jgi:hypothetical protein